MGKSARVLGWEFSKTAQEMNRLLKEHGYLYGEPGAYGLTEKGKIYAEEQYHSRGTGGYAHYNRNWETWTWNEETAAALAADMAHSFSAPVSEAFSSEEDDDTLDDEEDFLSYRPRADKRPEIEPKFFLIAGVVLGGLIVAPYVKPWWNNTVRPAAKKMRDSVKGRKEAESGES